MHIMPLDDQPGAPPLPAPAIELLDLRGSASPAGLSPDTRAVLIDGGVDLHCLESGLGALQLVVIEFTSPLDGRGFSIARRLKSRAEFRGRIRACGNVIIDQYQYLQRSGFDEVALPDPEQLNRAQHWREQAGALTLAYQSAAHRDPLAQHARITVKPRFAGNVGIDR